MDQYKDLNRIANDEVISFKSNSKWEMLLVNFVG